MKQKILQMMFAALVCAGANAQVNSGSNGSDGAFNPTTNNTVINMADHPNGIYQYTSVNIPGNVTVTFIPNVNDTPVVWLVQSNVVITGIVDISGQPGGYSAGVGGPGGYRGGNAGQNASSGLGSGGGGAWTGVSAGSGGAASYGTLGSTNSSSGSRGLIYGNSYLIPLLGGSGGGGSSSSLTGFGGGGGGAILIASSATIQLNGSISAYGGSGYSNGGDGSGGAVRLVALTITGSGVIATTGINVYGDGRVRFDTYLNNFAGAVSYAVFTQGSQFVVIPTAGSGTQLTITSVAGMPVSASPTGIITTPDAVISAQQSNPVPVVVQCSNIPLNTAITVTVTPVGGAPVSAVGYNSTGSLGSSTATISITMPRGGGFIYASAATGN
ncbi:MAG TPA: hypothetical protein DCQ92_17500 [Verrucomicrobia subdivision 3 bacterium]|nr:hypothetical protein [Limisphaerales bacterium]